jgi:8-oxo-dGTP pyrophosphatase MutT (NUDIX family)
MGVVAIAATRPLPPTLVTRFAIPPPWTALPAHRRTFTVEQVRRRCVDLPPPSQRTLGHDVSAPRDAGVLVPIVDLEGEAGVVCTRRPATMTFHRGDWVFPGGRVDAAVDDGPEAAARREAAEELGVPSAAIDVVGALDAHGPIVTGFVLHPFVGIVAAGTVLEPDPHEVDDVAIVPISQLLAPGSYRTDDELPDHEPGPTAAVGVRPAISNRTHGNLSFFVVRDGEELWGTQGEILYDLLAHLVDR